MNDYQFSAISKHILLGGGAKIIEEIRLLLYIILSIDVLTKDHVFKVPTLREAVMVTTR